MKRIRALAAAAAMLLSCAAGVLPQGLAVPASAQTLAAAAEDGVTFDEEECILYLSGHFYQRKRDFQDAVGKSDVKKVIALPGAVFPEDCTELFAYCQAESMDFSEADTSGVVRFRFTFLECQNLTELNLSGFNTSNTSDMHGMFYSCSGLKSLDLSSFDTPYTGDMGAMFCECTSLTELDLSQFTTSHTYYIDHMFRDCAALEKIIVGDGWTTENLEQDEEKLASVFEGCEKLTGGNGTAYDAAHIDAEYARIDTADAPSYLTAAGDVTDPSSDSTAVLDEETGILTLHGCVVLKDVRAYINNTAVKQVYAEKGVVLPSDCNSMFMRFPAVEIIDLSNADSSDVRDMRGMFQRCPALTTVIVSETWTTEKTGKSYYMFEDSVKLVGGNGTKYDAQHTDAEYARIDRPDAPGYFTASGNMSAETSTGTTTTTTGTTTTTTEPTTTTTGTTTTTTETTTTTTGTTTTTTETTTTTIGTTTTTTETTTTTTGTTTTTTDTTTTTTGTTTTTTETTTTTIGTTTTTTETTTTATVTTTTTTETTTTTTGTTTATTGTTTTTTDTITTTTGTTTTTMETTATPTDTTTGAVTSESTAAVDLALSADSVIAERKAGETVKVPIRATVNKGYAAGTLDVAWDSSALILKAVQYDSELAPQSQAAPIGENGSCRLAFGSYIAEENFTGTGVFFTLEFEIAETAENGSYTIALSQPSAFDWTVRKLSVALTDGNVTLREPETTTTTTGTATTTATTETTTTTTDTPTTTTGTTTTTTETTTTTSSTTTTTTDTTTTTTGTTTTTTDTTTTTGTTTTTTETTTTTTTGTTTTTTETTTTTTTGTTTTTTETTTTPTTDTTTTTTGTTTTTTDTTTTTTGTTTTTTETTTTTTGTTTTTTDTTTTTTDTTTTTTDTTTTTTDTTTTTTGTTTTTTETTTTTTGTTTTTTDTTTSADLVLSADSVTAELKAGETVKVPIRATVNKGYAAGTLDVAWDSSALILKAVQYDSELAPQNQAAPIGENGSCRLAFGSYIAEENFTGTGVFFTLEFEIAETAENGSYTIALSQPSAYDWNVRKLSVSVTDGNVTLREPVQPVKGDYNGDGEVTLADAVLLARFISEDTTLTAEQIAAVMNAEPDFDGDGIVTLLDVRALLKKL